MADALRYVILLFGLFVLGFNLAVILHAPRIVPQAIGAWRVFLGGKSLLTAAVLAGVFSSLHGPWSWRLPLLALALTLTLVGIYLLDRAYRNNGRAPLLPHREP